VIVLVGVDDSSIGEDNLIVGDAVCTKTLGRRRECYTAFTAVLEDSSLLLLHGEHVPPRRKPPTPTSLIRAPAVVTPKGVIAAKTSCHIEPGPNFTVPAVAEISIWFKALKSNTKPSSILEDPRQHI
jgi:hypothetical protein